jgi:hypothetical protein
LTQPTPGHRGVGQAGAPAVVHPRHYDTVLPYGSVIVIAGRPDDVERFVELQ